MSCVLAPSPRVSLEPLAVPPSFSIVITAYQAAGTIRHAVSSALFQTHPALEVIVVDDGSTDDLDAALQPFEDRISVVRKENGGGASARNAGLAATSGEFMAILDADDAYHPQRLEVLSDLAQRRPDLDLITTDARFVVEGEGVGSFLEHNPFATVDQRTAIFGNCFVGGWPAVRVSRLRSVDGFDEAFRIAYDWDCWLRLILDGAEAGMVAEPYYDYVLHSDSLASARSASLRERARLLEKALGNPSLRSGEKGALELALTAHSSRAALAELDEALLEAGRRRSARLALSSELPWRARAVAALGALTPAVARRLSSADRPSRTRMPGSDR